MHGREGHVVRVIGGVIGRVVIAGAAREVAVALFTRKEELVLAAARQVRNPVNDMPPYPQTLLSDQEVADIFAYLQALPGRRPV